jgi:hypothetical protein
MDWNKQNIIIGREVAIECAIITSDELGIKLSFDNIITVSNKYAIWIHANGNDKNVLIDRQATLKRAVMSLKVLSDEEKPKGSDDLLLLADKFYKYIIK